MSSNPRNPLNSQSQPQLQANSVAIDSSSETGAVASAVEPGAESMEETGVSEPSVNSIQELPVHNPVRMERVPSTSELPVFA
jgi:hypothetical protein